MLGRLDSLMQVENRLLEKQSASRILLEQQLSAISAAAENGRISSDERQKMLSQAHQSSLDLSKLDRQLSALRHELATLREKLYPLLEARIRQLEKQSEAANASQQQLNELHLRLLQCIPDLAPFQHDPLKAGRFIQMVSHDSVQNAARNEYLSFARRETDERLAAVSRQLDVLQKQLRLQQKSRDFLEDIQSQNIPVNITQSDASRTEIDNTGSYDNPLTGWQEKTGSVSALSRQLGNPADFNQTLLPTETGYIDLLENLQEHLKKYRRELDKALR